MDYHEVGLRRYYGLGMDVDYVGAVRVLDYAARMRWPASSYLLGLCYYFGNGVEQDHKRAVDLFYDAAEFDDVRALFVMSWIRLAGLHIERSELKSLFWYSRPELCFDQNIFFHLREWEDEDESSVVSEDLRAAWRRDVVDGGDYILSEFVEPRDRKEHVDFLRKLVAVYEYDQLRCIDSMKQDLYLFLKHDQSLIRNDSDKAVFELFDIKPNPSIKMGLEDNRFGEVDLDIPFADFIDFAVDVVDVSRRDVSMWRDKFSTPRQMFTEYDDYDEVWNYLRLGPKSGNPLIPFYRAVDYCFGKHKCAAEWLNEMKTGSIACFLENPSAEYFRMIYDIHMCSISTECSSAICSVEISSFYYLIQLFPASSLKVLVPCLADIVAQERINTYYAVVWLGQIVAWMKHRECISSVMDVLAPYIDAISNNLRNKVIPQDFIDNYNCRLEEIEKSGLSEAEIKKEKKKLNKFSPDVIALDYESAQDIWEALLNFDNDPYPELVRVLWFDEQVPDVV
jgi:hypothetical protein